MWFFMGYILCGFICAISRNANEKRAVKHGVVILDNEIYKIKKIDESDLWTV